MGKSVVGPDQGGNSPGPTRTHYKHPGQTQAYTDLSFRDCPRQVCDVFEDFHGPQSSFTIETPLFSSVTNVDANIINVATGAISKAYFVVPQGGTLLSASIVGEDALAADDTNYLTFALTNKLASGSGAIAMLAATAANTTQATGGTGLTAVTGRTFTVNATARNLAVAAGDILEFLGTVSGTLANVVDNPRVKLVFAGAPAGWSTQITRTAGVPLSGVSANVAHGEWAGSLEATSEAQFVGLTWGDQLLIPAMAGPIFEARVKVGTVTTSQAVVIGLASAYNATLSSTTIFSWFRLAASLALTCETKDGTTSTLGQTGNSGAGAITLTANTYYLFRIDMTDLGNIRFWVDDLLFNTISVANVWSSVSPGLMQPIIGISKTTGTGVIGTTTDFVRVWWPRLNN